MGIIDKRHILCVKTHLEMSLIRTLKMGAICRPICFQHVMIFIVDKIIIGNFVFSTKCVQESLHIYKRLMVIHVYKKFKAMSKPLLAIWELSAVDGLVTPLYLVYFMTFETEISSNFKINTMAKYWSYFLMTK